MDGSSSTNYFSIWLDRTMENRGLSGRDLAKAIGADDASVSRWRNGKAGISLDVCERLADALGVDPPRLAVTAGLGSARLFGADPLPLPPPEGIRQRVRQQIERITGISEHVRQKLLDAYDDALKQEERDIAVGGQSCATPSVE